MPSDQTPSPLSVSGLFLLNSCKQVVSRTLTAPIERVQLLLQCEGELRKSGHLMTRYRGLINSLASAYRAEGARALWRGNLASCLSIFPTVSVTLLVDRYRNFQVSLEDETPSQVVGKGSVISLIGILNISLVYHLDFVRTRLAADVVNKDNNMYRQYTGTLDVYRKTLATDGFRGLHRGLVVCCIGNTLNVAATFGIYEWCKMYFRDSAGSSPWLASLSIICSAVTLVATYSFDTVRRRMMMRSGEREKYRGSLECVTSICREEGIGALWRGFSANVTKLFCGVLIYFVIDSLLLINPTPKRGIQEDK